MINIAKTPESVKNPTKVPKTCQEPKCGKDFMGHPIQKYCDHHRNPKNRAKRPGRKHEIGKCNKKLLHNFNRVTEVELNCSDCNEGYMIKLFPRVYVVPKFCEPCRKVHSKEN